KHHYATHGLKDLQKLNTQQFNEAKSEALFGPSIGLKKVQSIIDTPEKVHLKYGSYDNDVSARKFLEAISFIIEKQKKLDISNMYHMGSDNTSIMIDKKNGIAAIFKKQNLFLLEHHRIAHQLALAAKDSAEKVPYFENYNSIVNNLYSYF
ncbi:15986_t:CDS:2, partial [Dentiscutata heterogama]